MNIDYILYALEVAKTKSINKAAENLYISQPNLSRTINKLEEELGYKLFVRTNQGIEPTISGMDFLSHAQVMLDEYNKIKNLNNSQLSEYKFSISVPKGSYISKAFTEFISKIDLPDKMSIDFMECSSLSAVSNILDKNFNLGIIRIQTKYAPVYDAFLKEWGLVGQELCRFNYKIAMSKDDILASKEKLTKDDLADYIELAHGESTLPYNSQASLESSIIKTDKRIRIYDSMGQLQMLSKINKAFMIVFPLASDVLYKYNLVQKDIESENVNACDMIIYKKDYHRSNLDKLFLDELQKQINEL